MIIDDLDVFGVRAVPAETHAELLVDADAVLADPVTSQRFKAIAGRYAQEVQRSRSGTI